MYKSLIMLAGLPGTGKSISANKLATELNYTFIGQNEIRREFGMRTMPTNQDEVLRTTDRRLAWELNNGRGVIFDSVNRYGFRRQQVYGVASCCGVDAITIECVCSEKEAKKRMSARPESDTLLSDPRDPAVYDRLKTGWQDIEEDFILKGVDHVSYFIYDSEQNIFEKVFVGINSRDSKTLNKFIERVGKILTSD